MRLMMFWAHDWRCIPTSLANKKPAASISRGGYRREKVVPCHIGRATRPLPRIALSTRQEGLMRLMMAWAHDWRCIPSSLANKIPVASICRGCSRCAKTVPPAVTTSPIDSPFDRRGRQRPVCCLALMPAAARAAAPRCGLNQNRYILRRGHYI